MGYNAKPQIKSELSGYFLRDLCIRAVNHMAFEYFIMACICVNTVMLAIKWYKMSASVVSVCNIANYIFMAIFTIEAIIKIVALKKNYFRENWNVFDFTVVVLTFAVVLIT